MCCLTSVFTYIKMATTVVTVFNCSIKTVGIYINLTLGGGALTQLKGTLAKISCIVRVSIV